MTVYKADHVPSPTNHREMKYHGHHAVKALWKHRPADIVRIYITEERLKHFPELLKWCAAKKKAYHVVSPEDLRTIAGTVHHEGIAALAMEPPIYRDQDFLKAQYPERKQCLVYLDGVQNPHNVGSLLRVGAHFGTPWLLGREGQLPRLSPSAIRVSEGGAEKVHLAYLDEPLSILDKLRKKHGFVIAATSSHQGYSIYNYKFQQRTIFVLGAELTGISQSLLETADIALKIPGTGQIESLNVSVACGLLLGEYWRQVRAK